jgi:hypothetical protein
VIEIGRKSKEQRQRYLEKEKNTSMKKMRNVKER